MLPCNHCKLIQNFLYELIINLPGGVAAAEVRAEIGGRDRDQDHLEDHALLPESEFFCVC